MPVKGCLWARGYLTPTLSRHAATYDRIVGVSITGWVPGQSVGVVQCADPDAYLEGQVPREESGLPSPLFCDLQGFSRWDSGADGSLEIEHTVVGASMAERTDAGVTCDPDHPCVLNVFTADEGRFDPENPRVVFPLEFP